MTKYFASSHCKYLVVTTFLKIQRYTPAVATKVFVVILPKKLSWERLKNRDFEEIDFVKSPPHSLLDFKRAFLKRTLKSINHCD